MAEVMPVTTPACMRCWIGCVKCGIDSGQYELNQRRKGF